MASPFSKLREAAARSEFHLAMGQAPQVWKNHCQVLPMVTGEETLAWPGTLPKPRLMRENREFQNIRDFNFRIKNNEYESSTVIPRKAIEDDQTGLINMRMQEWGQAWGTFMDQRFAELLTNGGTAGNVAYDGTVFYADSRTIGDSANIDNNTTSAAATGTSPSPVELKNEMSTILATMLRYQDDRGRPGFGAQALGSVRLVIPPEFTAASAEAVRSTTIPLTVPTSETASHGGQVDNVYGQNLFQFDVLPYLSSTAIMYVNAVGAPRKPFIMAERLPLEVIMYGGANDIAENNGLMVLTRARFEFLYGEPRFSVRHTWS